MAYDIGYTDQTGTTGFAHKEMLLKIKALAEANGWTTMRYVTTDPTSHELILLGVGLSGDKQIYIGFRTYESIPADYYNLSAAAFTGYVAGNTWAAQPGFKESGIPAHNQKIDYYLQVNAQRINIGLKLGTPVYESGGAGLFFPLATPGQYPLPLYVSGMLNGTPATRYSDTVHTMGWKGSRANFAIRFTDGAWRSPATYPWNNAYLGGATSQLRDTNDQYPILRIALADAATGVYGYLDGIGYVSNFNNTVESMIQRSGTPITDNVSWTPQQRATAIETAGGVPWVCLQDVGRTSFNDYFALELK